MTDLGGFSHGHLLLLAKKTYHAPGAYNSNYRNSVILSATAFELFMSELEGFAGWLAERRDDRVAALHEVLREAERERVKVLFKVSLAFLAMTGNVPNKGEQPYQDLQLLIRIRNALLHEKFGRSGEVEFAKAPLVLRAAVERGLVPRLENYQQAVITAYLTNQDVAAWAYATVVSAMGWIAHAAPTGIREPLKAFVEQYARSE